MRKVDLTARRQLTMTEIKYLPPSANLEKQSELGKSFFSSLKLVVWKSLCDPASEIYKAWYSQGMSTFLSKKYYALAVTSALADIGFGIKAIAVSVTALLIKLGLEVYCDRYKPADILVPPGSKS